MISAGLVDGDPTEISKRIGRKRRPPPEPALVLRAGEDIEDRIAYCRVPTLRRCDDPRPALFVPCAPGVASTPRLNVAIS